MIPIERKRGLRIAIENRLTGEIVSEGEILGGEPAQTIQSGDSKYGSYPDEAKVTAWIRKAMADVVEASQAGALERMINNRAQRGGSYIGNIEFMTEFRYASLSDARYAADNCGFDWFEQAVYAVEHVGW